MCNEFFILGVVESGQWVDRSVRLVLFAKRFGVYISVVPRPGRAPLLVGSLYGEDGLL